MKNCFGNSRSLFVSLLLCIPLIFMSISCKKASEKTSEQIIEKSIGNDADVDIDKDKITIKTDEGTFTTDVSDKIWPNDIPTDLPEFKYGTIQSISTQQMDQGSGWILIFEKVPETALKAYQTELKNKGFKIMSTTTYGDSGQLTAEKEELSLFIMTGGGNATVTIRKENK